MTLDPSKQVLHYLNVGDPRAADDVVRRYCQALVRIADQRLSDSVAQREDGEDVVQSVFRTFFRRTAKGEFHFDTSSDLWRLLVCLTIQKARAHARRHLRAKRDVRQEQALDDTETLPPQRTDPTPEEAVEFHDLLSFALKGFPSKNADAYEKILFLTLAGDSQREVAEQLGVSHTTVQRVLGKIRLRLQSEFTEEFS